MVYVLYKLHVHKMTESSCYGFQIVLSLGLALSFTSWSLHFRDVDVFHIKLTMESSGEASHELRQGLAFMGG